MIRILLAREMEAILFLARWHTFFTGARAINAVARVSFRVVTRRGTAGRRVQFLSCGGTGDDLMKTQALVFPWGKKPSTKNNSTVTWWTCTPSRPNEWDKKRADNRKIDFEIKNGKLSATLMICSANYTSSWLKKKLRDETKKNEPFYIGVFVQYNKSIIKV